MLSDSGSRVPGKGLWSARAGERNTQKRQLRAEGVGSGRHPPHSFFCSLVTIALVNIPGRHAMAKIPGLFLMCSLHSEVMSERNA